MDAEPAPIHEPTNTYYSIAQETGKFYNSLLTVYLSNNGTDKQSQQDQVVANLPTHIQKVYKEGIQRYQEQLQANHDLMVPHRGNEIQHLIAKVMQGQEKSEQEIQEVISQVTPDKIRYIEPAPGIAILQAEKDFYEFLRRNQIAGGGSDATALLGNDIDDPSFMLVRRLSLEKSLAEDGSQTATNPSVRHEMHHLVWHFLEKAKFVRGVQESTPELSKAFDHFRDELAAYIIQGRDVETVDTYAMIYTEDETISKVANDAKVYASLCIQLSKMNGVDPATFLYPAMTSRNFVELNNNLTKIIPFSRDVDFNSLGNLYALWEQKGKLSPQNSKALAEILKRWNPNISSDVMQQIATQNLNSTNIKKLDQFFYKMDTLGKFAEFVGKDSNFVTETSQIALHQRIPLPAETIKVITELPVNMRSYIPLDTPPKDFCTTVISIWNIDKPELQKFYSLLINSSPEMRTAFDEAKEALITRGTREYKGEFGYDNADSEKRKKVDVELERKIQIMRSL